MDKYSKQERQALRKLDIPDFRHITKDKLMQFVSMTSKMDPEVAKAAINQFPDFANLVKGSLVDYKEILMETLSQDSEADQRVFSFYDSVRSAIENTLYGEDLKFEQKQWCIEQLQELADQFSAQERANKRHRFEVVASAAAAILGTLGIAASLLGGSSQISDSSGSEDI